MTSLIELKDIHKTYYIGGKLPVYALRGLSLKVEPGEFIAIWDRQVPENLPFWRSLVFLTNQKAENISF